MPALGKSVSHPGWLSPLPTSPGALASVQEGEQSGAGSAVGQDMGHGWKPPAGISVPNPVTSPHHHVFSFSPSPLQRGFRGAGGLVGAHGALMLFCPREQWRAAAWASPSFVLLC